jgi:hypothetical protein
VISRPQDPIPRRPGEEHTLVPLGEARLGA